MIQCMVFFQMEELRELPETLPIDYEGEMPGDRDSFLDDRSSGQLTIYSEDTFSDLATPISSNPDEAKALGIDWGIPVTCKSAIT